jgi:hypothetical protein
MQFELPTLPHGYRGDAWALQVMAWRKVTSEQIKRILGAVDQVEAGGVHGTLYRPVVANERKFELRIVIGAHDANEDGPRECHVHLDLSLTLDDDPTDRVSGSDAELLLKAVAETVGSITTTVNAYWRFPRADGSFAVELPIPLEAVSGFSQIAGVRIVQRDPKSEQELYSMILDEAEDERSASVFVPLDLVLDDKVFVKAWEKALAIAGLVIEPPMPTHEQG